MRDLVQRLSQALGGPIRLAGVPRWMVRALGVFVPLVREINEMLYQWDEPFVVDDRRFRAMFRVEPADPTQAAHATLEWVDWFNTRRLLEPIGYVPPAEHEAVYYQHRDELVEVTSLALRQTRYGSPLPRSARPPIAFPSGLPSTVHRQWCRRSWTTALRRSTVE
jgi:hypothetical protein